MPRSCTSRPAATASCSAARAGRPSVSFDFYPYLYGFGGSIFKNQAAGDYSVTLNSEAGPHGAAILYLRLATRPAIRKTASLDQAEVIQNMVDRQGRAHHDRDLGMVADGRSRQVGRRRQGRVRADAARAGPSHRARPRPLARRHCQERPGRSQARAPSSSCAGSRPRRRRSPTPSPAAFRSTRRVYRDPISQERNSAG